MGCEGSRFQSDATAPEAEAAEKVVALQAGAGAASATAAARNAKADEDPAAAERAATVVAKHADIDPRWDDDGFNAWADEAQIQFVLVEYLRELYRAGGVLPAAQWIPPHAYHSGAPPSGADIYNVLHLWVTTWHPDPWGDHLADLVELLKDAEHSDLVMIDFCCCPREHYTAAGDGSHTTWEYSIVDGEIDRPCTDSRLRVTTGRYGNPRWTDLTIEQERRRKAFEEGIDWAWQVTYSGLCTVVLHKQPERTPLECRKKIHESVWLTAELMLAAYCQRIVNSSDPAVKEHFSPAMLTDPVQRLRKGYQSGLLRVQRESDLEGIIIPGLTKSMALMVPVKEDHSGFTAFCSSSRVAWIKVGYIRRFVSVLQQTTSRVVLFPRRQELPRGTFYEGAPPKGPRRFVVSHGWACEHHPTPSAERIQRLARALDTADANDEDSVFLDYASLFQRGRPALGDALGIPTQRDRTVEEGKCFRTALAEMSRMYAYGGCEVIVLSQLEHWRAFPGKASIVVPSPKFSDFKMRDCEHSALWGWINSVPYHNRGWCAAEFSCALKANIIANLTDPDVQDVLKARAWPQTVDDYNQMMEDPSIEFTANGDREYVAYLFFKMSFDLRGVYA